MNDAAVSVSKCLQLLAYLATHKPVVLQFTGSCGDGSWIGAVDPPGRFHIPESRDQPI
ncbi:hypothetical protein [Bradyrhizobium sp. CCBAU 53421]|uniref:hypothetical protein n=1 Tax=Bradyrhizobium sp. CCBAU 53421 TaxID=1325120 RepID=UPI00188AAFE3|nr:hypothetical protein [Bradyrhizobium sp. CCBAU 53421]